MNVSKRKKGIVRTFVWEQSCSGDSGWTSLIREGLIWGRIGLDLWLTLNVRPLM